MMGSRIVRLVENVELAAQPIERQQHGVHRTDDSPGAAERQRQELTAHTRTNTRPLQILVDVNRRNDRWLDVVTTLQVLHELDEVTRDASVTLPAEHLMV